MILMIALLISVKTWSLPALSFGPYMTPIVHSKFALMMHPSSRIHLSPHSFFVILRVVVSYIATIPPPFVSDA